MFSKVPGRQLLPHPLSGDMAMILGHTTANKKQEQAKRKNTESTTTSTLQVMKCGGQRPIPDPFLIKIAYTWRGNRFTSPPPNFAPWFLRKSKVELPRPGIWTGHTSRKADLSGMHTMLLTGSLPSPELEIKWPHNHKNLDTPQVLCK